MAESAFMLRQRKLLEDIKENKGVPPLKSLYGPVTPIANTETSLQNITGPGGQEFYDATNRVKDAYKEGGVSSALGIGLRETPGVLAATVRDTLTPEPLRNLAGEAKKVAQVAFTGKAVPTTTKPIFNKTSFEDRAANNLLYSENAEQLDVPLIKEKQNARRDTELGKIDAKINDSGNVVYSIGGNTMEVMNNKNSLNINQPNNVAAAYERKFRNMGTNQMVAEPTVSEEQLKKYDYQEGLKSGRTQKPIDPYNGLNNSAKQALMLQELRNRQSGLESSEANKIAADRNRIMEQQGLAELNRTKLPESKVVRVPDGMGGTVDKIVTANPDGTYPDPNNMNKFQLSANHPAISFLRNNLSDNNKQLFKNKYGYLPEWAMTK